MSLASVHAGKGVLAPKQTVVLRYSDWIDMNASQTVPATFTLKANGMFDPQVAAGGHQPRGFDQMAALYRKYEVKKCLLEVWCNPTDVRGMVTITNRWDNTILSANKDLFEDPEAVIKPFNSESGPVYIKKQIVIKKFASPADFDILDAPVTGDPGKPIYFKIGVAGMGSDDPGTVTCRFRLTYEAEFHDPKELTSS